MLKPLKLVTGTLVVVIIGIILLDVMEATAVIREMFAFSIAAFLSIVVVSDYIAEKRN
jgi:hypothetical protein